ncbi:competence/damage-inducible protein A [Sinomicrobium weinanense]|uniref:CinA-like protein n=1 Tax=Sinomicrobium weinanense TaxID=2842200 RepID=A0A926Q2T0_9FLAO|nr:competence/damage-inducible protein A [Sinomicrobium weinanense]MBC9796957.1 competence/damage-inducible protein A [Sinomicrobium weinanense]MBU3124959.1 competence/damage-inducible protein A [Sinomicrobium weinanense]
MQAEIITIGDEILIGQIVDTNAAHMARELNRIGISVYQVTSVQDEKNHILQALKEAGGRAEVVVITGGLGPTKDDITKHTLCEFFGDTLVRNEMVLAHIEKLFAKYIDAPISDLNRNQAMVPSRATVLMNRYGTAPGMWLEKDRTVFISLPGVPYEMKALMEDEVLPRLQEAYDRPYILHKTVITYGMGESALADRIEDWENSLPPFIKLAYLPHPGKVLLRLTAKGTDKKMLETAVDEKIRALHLLIGDMVYGMENDQPLEALIGKAMSGKNITLALAESCTGGKVAEQVTSVPGASAYFRGAIVSYSTAVKTDVLKIPETLIDKHSVVSAEVAEAMARGAQQLLKSDFAISTTGNAGPEKGESDADVGTVYIGVATPHKVYSEKFNFGAPREKVVNKAANRALEILWKEILKN